MEDTKDNTNIQDILNNIATQDDPQDEDGTVSSQSNTGDDLFDIDKLFED